MTTISTGYTQDPDIFTRCRNMCDILREVYGSRFAGKMVGDLVASFDGEITPEFERKLTAMSRDALAIDAEGQRPVSDEQAEAERDILFEQYLSDHTDAVREMKHRKGL